MEQTGSRPVGESAGISQPEGRTVQRHWGCLWLDWICSLQRGYGPLLSPELTHL